MADSEHRRKLENMMHSAPFMKLTGAKVVVGKGDDSNDDEIARANGVFVRSWTLANLNL